MKKKVKINPTNKVQCKICGKYFSLYGMPSHIITHDISIIEYVEKFGEFRKTKLNQRTKIRNIETHKCKICGNEYSMVGIATHLIYSHNQSVSEYVKKFGEFRRNHISENEQRNQNLQGNFQCLICNEKFATNKRLMHHIISQHSIDSIEYVKKYIFKDIPQLCPCGCGKEVNYTIRPPYKLKCISGHNSKYANGMSGKVMTKQTRLLQREAALNKKYVYQSKAEKEISDFLKSNNIKVIDTFRKIGIEIDIFLPDFNIGIEYDGLRWHSEWFAHKDRNYHITKTNICNKAGIQLIHIFEDEWESKKDIVKSKLLSLCNVNKIKIPARKCDVRLIDKQIGNEFCKKYHLQGVGKGKYHIGLYYQDELISVIVVSKLRNFINNSTVSISNVYELNRFCTKSGYTVIGGFAKMIKFISTNITEIDNLISYADLRWSTDNNIYTRNNFKLERKSPPNYWYLKNNKRYHRYNFTKYNIVKMGGDPNLSESVNMKNYGYDRIWDCGTLKYSIKFR